LLSTFPQSDVPRSVDNQAIGGLSFSSSLVFAVFGAVSEEIAGGVRLTDRIGIGVLTRLVNRDLVDEVLGADLLWRVQDGPKLPVVRTLPDGSYESFLMDPKIRARRNGQRYHGRPLDERSGIPVRVVEYEVANAIGSSRVLACRVPDSNRRVNLAISARSCSGVRRRGLREPGRAYSRSL